MDIKTKFDLGQKVWCARSVSVETTVDCETCGKTGEVKIKDETFKCPKCNGKSKRGDWVWRAMITERPTQVGKICVELYDKRYLGQNDCHKNKVQYMLESTGVGSGTLWNEESLFASEEEALAWCEKKNEELMAKKGLDSVD